MSTSVETAEHLAQRALDVNVLSEHELQSVWSELGTRNASLRDFTGLLLRRNLLTNYQIDRITNGFRTGYFYGDYKVLYCVGSGTFARVFRAVHRETGKVYAVKVLRNSKSAEPKEVEAFRREGELGLSLKHPNIVPTHQVFSKAQTHYIVMDFIEGRNLREQYKVRKTFEPLEAAKILADICAGLHYAFQQGVTHRDLKMSNVLLSSSGPTILVDFGLAALEEEIAGGEAANERAIDYAGLERATGMRKDDTRSDIYFAGCMLYQMLSGKPPLSETKNRMERLSKSRYQSVPPLIEVAPDCPAPLVMVTAKAMEFAPERRYQTPGEMLADLKLAIKRVESGTNAAGGKNGQEIGAEGIRPDGQPRRLMVIESDVKRQDILRELFKRNGYRVLVTGAPERALDRFRNDPATADVVIFCSYQLGMPAVDMFNTFGEEAATRELPCVLLLEESQRAWKAIATTSDHRLSLSMPIKLRQLREAVVLSLQAKATA